MSSWKTTCQTWNQTPAQGETGILVGADLLAEKWLPWWWQHLRTHEPTLPVAFVDLGMSPRMKQWTLDKGLLIPLPFPEGAIASVEEMDPAHFPHWHKTCGTRFGEKRGAWFKKPAACLQTPFQKTLWLDLDCQVQAPLSPLFDLPPALYLTNYDTPPKQSYNAGVILFKRGDPRLALWAQKALSENQHFGGDQDLLLSLIDQEKWEIIELERKWNWSRTWGSAEKAHIIHWHGDAGKQIIAWEIQKEEWKA